MPHSMSPDATQSFGKHRFTVYMAAGAKALPSYGSGGYSGEQEIATLPHARFMILSKKTVPHGSGKNASKRMEIEVLLLPHHE